MKRALILLLVPALALADPLPARKTDLRPRPPNVPVSKWVGATDINGILDALNGTGDVVSPLVKATGSTTARTLPNWFIGIPDGVNLCPLASPALTGTPTAPTAAADTNTTQLATTAYVVGQAGTATPVVNGTGAAGSSARYSRQDHVHPTDTSRAPLASPTFTGTVTAPTVTTTAAGSSLVAEAWTAATLLNSWVNFGGTFASAGYYKDAAGVVRLHGVIKSGTIGTSAFTLPVGYRPIATMLFPVNSAGAYGYVSVTSAGIVTPSAGNASDVSLDPISFRAEN